MRKTVVFTLLMILPLVAFSQSSKRKAPGQAPAKTLEGVTLTRNSATAKPNYELVKESDTVLAVKHKKKKKGQTGTLKCGCIGDGFCHIEQDRSGHAVCLGDCGNGCTLVVTQTAIKPPM